jgi:transposase
MDEEGNVCESYEIENRESALNAFRSIVRHKKSLGEEMNMLKNRVHSILTGHGITIHATDIFGRRGIRSILEESSKLTAMDRIVLSDLIERISDLKERERILEDQMAVACKGNTSMRLLMTIPGINLYSASAISSNKMM